jgi:hypothetical protein
MRGLSIRNVRKNMRETTVVAISAPACRIKEASRFTTSAKGSTPHTTPAIVVNALAKYWAVAKALIMRRWLRPTIGFIESMMVLVVWAVGLI